MISCAVEVSEQGSGLTIVFYFVSSLGNAFYQLCFRSYSSTVAQDASIQLRPGVGYVIVK